MAYEGRYWCERCYVEFCKKKFGAKAVTVGPKGWTKLTVAMEEDPEPETLAPRQRTFYFTRRNRAKSQT